MTLITLVALVHVLSALLYVAGYAGTNLLTEVARRSADEPTLRAAITFSGVFDRRLMIPFGTGVGLSGLLLAVVSGYALTAPWIAASIVLYGAVIAVGIVIWGRRRPADQRGMPACDPAARHRSPTPRAITNSGQTMSQLSSGRLIPNVCVSR